MAWGQRATKRRLNGYEYEETLRDLLSLPYLEVKAFLPDGIRQFRTLVRRYGSGLNVTEMIASEAATGRMPRSGAT